MEPFFSLYPNSFEVFHGDHFSIFVDGSDSFWVVSNYDPTVFKGPLDKGTARKLFSSANEIMNFLILKGLSL